MTRHSMAILVTVALVSHGNPAHAQREAPSGIPIDITGGWGPIFHEDVLTANFGGESPNYLGLPMNDAARMRADSHSEEKIAQVEFQCRRELVEYALHGVLGRMHVTAIRDPETLQLTAYQMYIHGGMPVYGTRTIHMDGRPHPPAEAPHTWGGFSTGVWERGVLTVTTTHLKAFYMRRPSVPASDQRTLTEIWRRHGNYLTMTMVAEDPVFFTEPVVRSQTWQVDLTAPPPRTFRCHGALELPSLDGGRVPHWLPGTNPAATWISEWYGVPIEATRGGAETMYPEYRKQLEQTFSTLERCTRNCGPGVGNFATGVPEEDR